jgi:stage III sporulation protein AF
MAVQLEKGVEEELMEQFGLEIARIELTTKDDSQDSFPENLEMVSVHLKQPETKVTTVEVVQPVSIDTETPLPSKDPTEESEKVAAFLSQQWNVTEKVMEVSVEGGMK